MASAAGDEASRWVPVTEDFRVDASKLHFGNLAHLGETLVHMLHTLASQQQDIRKLQQAIFDVRLRNIQRTVTRWALQVLARAFAQWQENMGEQSRQRRGMQLAADRWQKRAMASAFHHWVQYVEGVAHVLLPLTRHRLLAQAIVGWSSLILAKEQILRRKLLRALWGWKHFLLLWKHIQIQVAQKRADVELALLEACWQGWVELLQLHQQEQQRASQKVADHLVGSAWRAWRQVVAENRQRQAMARRQCVRICQRWLHEVLVAWCSLLKEKRRRAKVLSLCGNRWYQRYLALALFAWMDHVAQSRRLERTMAHNLARWRNLLLMECYTYWRERIQFKISLRQPEGVMLSLMYLEELICQQGNDYKQELEHKSGATQVDAVLATHQNMEQRFEALEALLMQAGQQHNQDFQKMVVEHGSQLKMLMRSNNELAYQKADLSSIEDVLGKVEGINAQLQMFQVALEKQAQQKADRMELHECVPRTEVVRMRKQIKELVEITREPMATKHCLSCSHLDVPSQQTTLNGPFMDLHTRVESPFVDKLREIHFASSLDAPEMPPRAISITAEQVLLEGKGGGIYLGSHPEPLPPSLLESSLAPVALSRPKSANFNSVHKRSRLVASSTMPNRQSMHKQTKPANQTSQLSASLSSNALHNR